LELNITDLSAVHNTRHLTSQKETSNMDIKVQSVVTIAGEAEIDRAIATLVLAFASDRPRTGAGSGVG
jgi:hypothetical protein